MRQTLVLVFGLFLMLDLAASTSDIVQADSLQIQSDSDSLLVCEGTSVMLLATGAANYSWSPAADFDNPDSDNPTMTPSASQWYFVTGQVGDTTCTDSIFIELIDPTFAVNLSRTDTICPGDFVIATFTANGPITGITWEPEDSVSSPMSLDSTELAPTETTEYVVTAEIGNCTVSDTFTVEVVPFSLRLITPDTVFLCKPDTDAIRVVLMPSDADIVWTSEDTTYELQVTGSNQVATVFPPVSYDYNVTATFRGCTLSHDIHVRVDSLPDLNLIVIPEKDPYCAGDEVIIFAADADTLLYPDIEFMWQPMDGQIQDSTNTGNVYVVLQDTTMFIRNVENNACRDSSSVLLNVVPPDIPLSVTDTTLCPGDKFTVEVLDREIEDLEWDPPQGLSCTTCFEPEVTVGESPMYTVTGEKDGCPVSGMLTVGTFSFLPINFVPSVVQACPGDEIPVSIDTTGLFNLDISVTGNNSVSCGGCPNPVITVGGSGILEVHAEERLDSFCGAFGQVQIVIPAPEQETGNAIIVCAGQDTPVDLSGMGFINPRLTIDIGSLSCNTCLDPVISGLNAPTILTVTDDNVSPGFCVRETQFPVILADTAEVEAYEISDPSPGQGEFVGITLVTMPQPPAGTVFNWVVNGIPHGENMQTVTVQLNEEDNIVTVSWINSNGCLQTYTEIIPTNPPGVMIPNAFTPDDDEMNVNEMFRPSLEGNVSIENMLVFNRWGQLVYEGNDPDGWDGTYNGEPAPPEVYGYLIRLQFPNGIRTFKGDVTLIR